MTVSQVAFAVAGLLGLALLVGVLAWRWVGSASKPSPKHRPPPGITGKPWRSSGTGL